MYQEQSAPSSVKSAIWNPPRIDHDHSGDEATAAKLWGVYISEAKKNDNALVKSWKSDMEGMLIFAGLFSVSLTAFIMESYKILIPDSGDSTMHLLTQISQQLATAANGSSFTAPVPTVFVPPTRALQTCGLSVSGSVSPVLSSRLYSSNEHGISSTGRTSALAPPSARAFFRTFITG
ncbi:hypothetical protein DFH09DRAFT_1038329 [Mycena vulgaris]|nr:hypothetical protein DFH09DRAFT_1038329 [Mycena vulgaris]